MRRRVVGPLVAALAALASGCGFHGVYSLPLPGAAGNGSDTYQVRVQLSDVLDLVPYSAVKVNGATVGHVADIAVQDGHALVTCQLPDSVHLPADATAQVQQTSVLGEKFVELEPPHGMPARGRLGDGDVIPLARTGTDATVEEVLGALSLLLNGGGVGQLHTITHELTSALSGRTAVARATLDDLDTFVAGLDRQKAAIITALRGVDRLTRTVHRQESSLVAAVEHMPHAVAILADDRRRLTTMLTSLQRLGTVADHVVSASRADLLANLRALRPTLDRLARVGGKIPDILSVLITYPTADSVEQEYFGDYGNLSLTIDLSAQSLLQTFGPGGGGTTAGGSRHRSGAGHHRSGGSHNGSGGGLPLPPLPRPITRWSPGKTVGGLLSGALR